jgi:hypothetical protein
MAESRRAYCSKSSPGLFAEFTPKHVQVNRRRQLAVPEAVAYGKSALNCQPLRYFMERRMVAAAGGRDLMNRPAATPFRVCGERVPE